MMSWRNSLYHQMYIVQNSGMQHLAATSWKCSMYESLLCLRCKKKVVVGKWISNTSKVYASQTFRWNCWIFFGIVAYFFLLLHTFFYWCINFFTVAINFLFLHANFCCWSSFSYCCKPKIVLAIDKLSLHASGSFGPSYSHLASCFALIVYDNTLV